MERKLEDILRRAGAIVREGASKIGDVAVSEKSGSANFVTEYDVAVQRFLETELTKAFPGSAFLAEEDGEDKKTIGSGLTFVIDPIDGTTNFMCGLSRSAVSVALFEDGEAIAGAVLDPFLDELYYAEKGKGAKKNGNAIKPSSRTGDRAIIALGTSPYYKETLGRKTFDIFYAAFMAYGDIRRIGSAALDICSVACGASDAFFELSLSPWDHAAASLIAREAGAIVTDKDGNPLRYDAPCSVLAASKTLYEEFKALCDSTIRGV